MSFESQENFIESRNPPQLAMCVILAALYIGLAKLCFKPLWTANHWQMLIYIEGFFVTFALLSLWVGSRPYLFPASLQINNKGIKYRDAYWPRRKTINWEQIFKLYAGPDMIIILYHPHPDNKIIWPLFINSDFFADKEKVAESIISYCPNPVVKLAALDWRIKLFFKVVLVIFCLAILVFIARFASP